MNIWTVIPLGTSLAYVLVFALAIQKIEKRVNRAFVYYLGLAAFWSFNSFVVRMQTAPEHALFWNRLLAVALIAALVAYFHFARLYTGRPAGKG
ncbi:MAG: histidine kinase N-terminal 7TM domain-containing protein, partial [Dehalococcoidales bacterium]|nr:histidine kinase N-terminal 7TM domain-containing protein [Dehalococcoidales bacterium]